MEDNNARIRLFLFPFAGGNIYSYRLLEDKFGGKIIAHPLELPGRGRRFTEALVTDIRSAVDDLFAHIREYLVKPYAFFGHSMGSVLAYLLTVKIKQEGYPLPVHIFCSGRSGLWNKRPESWYLLPSDDFWRKITSLGGVPGAEALNDEIRTIFEPILRADFKLIQSVEQNGHAKDVLVDVPTTVFLGKDDSTTTEPSSWHRYTQKPTQVMYFEGDHFYFNGQYALLVEHVKNILSNYGYC